MREHSLHCHHAVLTVPASSYSPTRTACNSLIHNACLRSGSLQRPISLPDAAQSRTVTSSMSAEASSRGVNGSFGLTSSLGVFNSKSRYMLLQHPWCLPSQWCHATPEWLSGSTTSTLACTAYHVSIVGHPGSPVSHKVSVQFYIEPSCATAASAANLRNGILQRPMSLPLAAPSRTVTSSISAAASSVSSENWVFHSGLVLLSSVGSVSLSLAEPVV